MSSRPLRVARPATLSLISATPASSAQRRRLMRVSALRVSHQFISGVDTSSFSLGKNIQMICVRGFFRDPDALYNLRTLIWR